MSSVTCLYFTHNIVFRQLGFKSHVIGGDAIAINRIEYIILFVTWSNRNDYTITIFTINNKTQLTSVIAFCCWINRRMSSVSVSNEYRRIRKIFKPQLMQRIMVNRLQLQISTWEKPGQQIGWFKCSVGRAESASNTGSGSVLTAKVVANGRRKIGIQKHSNKQYKTQKEIGILRHSETREEKC